MSSPVGVGAAVATKSRARRARGGDASGGDGGGPPRPSCLGTLLLLLPIIMCFFCFGVFIGSRFVGAATSPQAHPPSAEGLGEAVGGLPGTRNRFAKWGSDQSNPGLRGADAQVALPHSASLHAAAPLSESAAAITSVAAAAAAAAANPPFTVTSSTLDRSYSLYATKSSYMLAPNDLDFANVVFGAWVYLEKNEFADKDMRTILSNKKAGCDARPEQYGLALYVNSWQSTDHKLYVEFGGKLSGCHKLDSGSVKLEQEKWYHVAVSLVDGTASLFVDGKSVQSTSALEQHQVQTNSPLVVGQYRGGEYALYGNVSQLAVVHPSGPLESAQLDAVVASLMSFEGGAEDSQKRKKRREQPPPPIPFFAFYQLSDAALEVPESKALESVRGKHGIFHFPIIKGQRLVGVPIPLLDGVNGRPVTAEMKKQSDELGRTRREKIKSSMAFVWESYRKYAWGRDELKPLSRQGQDNWGGMGVTLVDSLDTLWIMGMRKEFDEAKEWVRSRLSFRNAGSVSVFETTIRELGGLLSAYDLSGDKVFLDKAVELGSLLSPAFNSRTGIAYGMVNLQTGEPTQGWAGNSAILSELGTLQLEFRNLAMASDNPALELKAMKAIQLMNTKEPQHGLYPIKVDIGTGTWADNIVTFGALGDSFYEYLLKVWIQGGKKEKWLRQLYDRAMDGVVGVLLKASDLTGLAFLSDWNGHSNIRKMDHLVCFMPGALALGAYTDPAGLDSPRAKRDLAVAKALMYTCREMYHRMRSGISPEYVEFPPGQDMVVGSTAPFYILRPETAESLFILNQLTGDPIYREWAWEIFTAIEKYCKTAEGYGALQDVNNPEKGVDDRMESFFLAETIKYLYLAQDPDKPIDLNEYVFNTEAHPTKIFGDKHKPVPPR